jgi:hypothetical protein
MAVVAEVVMAFLQAQTGRRMESLSVIRRLSNQRLLSIQGTQEE